MSDKKTIFAPIAALLFGIFLLAAPASADQFLPDIRPTGTQFVFGLHGDYQLFLSSGDSSGTSSTRLFHTLTLEPDVRLTSDFRFHARWRPIKNEVFFNSLDKDVPNGGTESFGAKASKSESLERAFFEARLFGSIDTAGGLIPLEFHNLYMAQDDVGGGLIAKNNISSGMFTNVRVMGFGTTSGKGSKLSGREGRNVSLFGVDAIADTARYTIEGTLGLLSDNDNDAVKKAGDGDEAHLGVSVIRIKPGRSNTLRVFRNTNNAKDKKSGNLIVAEQSILYLGAKRWDRPTWYLNGFFGTENYQSMAAGSLKNIGFLFDQVGGVQLNNTGINRLGFATGFLMGASRDFSVIPEIATVLDQSEKKNNQVAAGIRVQMRLFDTSFLRWDTVFLQQSKDPNSASTTLQAVYKF